jgi:hypothetical protein
MSKLLLCFFCLILAARLGAQTPTPTAVPSLSTQSTAIKDVPVPIPREIFATLDKFAHSNWRAVQRPELAHWKPRGNQSEIAFLLGAVIAEGFLAVEAEDTVEVKEIGQAVLKLARGLGVERAALRRSRSIVEHAEKGDWSAVRGEWDGVPPDVEQGMKDLRSEQLAQIVSLGGWLRGTQMLGGLILQDYSTEKAEILRQPALLDHFDRTLMAMPRDLKNQPLFARMRDGIQKVRTLLSSNQGSIPRETVEQIVGVAESSLKDLSSKSGKR